MNPTRSEPGWTNCPKAPAGWVCTRTPGHDGPCAAREMSMVQLTLSKAVEAVQIDGPWMSVEQIGLARLYASQLIAALDAAEAEAEARRNAA